MHYSSSDEPPTTGVKFYHITSASNYESAQVRQIENGDSLVLGTGELKRGNYITASFFPERSRKNYWAWCLRSHTGQHPFYQGDIDAGWRLANASWGRNAKLNGNDAIVDVLIFSKINDTIEMGVLDLAITKGMTEGTLAELIETSKQFPQFRFIALTLN
ncbi:hypothetical protein [Oceaniferula flava]|uniref:Uncharacterized protein n=1 Tax=Oceaniferula flava TaxID=2800421 RepID=A0AAE2S9F1_9BACT|nr:hypothetical protein [Oceaniferula flavus]MBK1853745.1 hypothetical protein [Oceaniferula flavus]